VEPALLPILALVLVDGLEEIAVSLFALLHLAMLTKLAFSPRLAIVSQDGDLLHAVNNLIALWSTIAIETEIASLKILANVLLDTLDLVVKLHFVIK